MNWNRLFHNNHDGHSPTLQRKLVWQDQATPPAWLWASHHHNDGWPDIFVASVTGNQPLNTRCTFTDVAAKAGVSGAMFKGSTRPSAPAGSITITTACWTCSAHDDRAGLEVSRHLNRLLKQGVHSCHPEASSLALQHAVSQQRRRHVYDASAENGIAQHFGKGMQERESMDHQMAMVICNFSSVSSCSASLS